MFFGTIFACKNANAESVPEVYIKSVNPGYTIDGVQNVGEIIEIARINSDHEVSLAGWSISYINSSGNVAELAELSKYTWASGETILLQLASSPGSELAQVRYGKTLAFKAGPLSLVYNGAIVDSVCWTGKDDCYFPFDSKNPTTLARNLETGNFEHISNYHPDGDGVLKEAFEDSGDLSEGVSQCKGVVFSEILGYYEILQNEQFVELYNSGHETVRLDGCSIKYKNKYYPLSGMIAPEGYFAEFSEDLKITKNPSTSNVLELIDANGVVLDKLVYPNGQRKGASYALIGYDSSGGEIWKVTYAPTPGEPNNYQEFRTCEEGKVINETTGNCVKITSVMEKICGEGQYLNILTGRCKKYDTEKGPKECKEGYFYNEETGRCKKLKENNGADYALVPETFKESSNFVALNLVLLVLLVGGIYIIYEFRHEIRKIFRKVTKR